jgi:hypothetical protein
LVPSFFITFPPLTVKTILPSLEKKNKKFILNLCFRCFAKELGEEHVTCLSDKHFVWSRLIFHAKTQENTFRVISQICFWQKQVENLCLSHSDVISDV